MYRYIKKLLIKLTYIFCLTYPGSLFALKRLLNDNKTTMNENFLPTTRKEMEQREWKTCDIILITGDAYVDHPSFGTALIGRYLESLGYKVGIIAQPDWKSDKDFLKLGKPNLFVGISAGNIDSMLAHYTANKRIRSDDAYTPGNLHGKRPNRATLIYTNKVKQLMPGIPIVLGGLEASMRRITHYDYWSETIKRSLILDSKASILTYGMAESSIAEIAQKLSSDQSLENIKGTVISKGSKTFNWQDHHNYIVLPSFKEVKESKEKFIEMTRIIEENSNPYNAKTLIQESDGQYVIINPPAMPLNTEQIDKIYDLRFARKPHPSYKEKIPAFEMIKDSVTILRGCPGACTFCSLGLHQGKHIQSRSQESIINELRQLAKDRHFKGTISDLGGPSANVYQMGCKNIDEKTKCKRPSCVYPNICTHFNTSTKEILDLYSNAKKLKGIKNINISSGIRYDIALKDCRYIEQLVMHHTPGHLKIAPEHFEESILKLMRKPSVTVFNKFVDLFKKINKHYNKEQYILPYMISSFPGCTLEHMKKTGEYLKKNKIKVEQVQDFIPLPMTIATAMYYTEMNYFTGQKIFVAKGKKDREQQKQQLLQK